MADRPLTTADRAFLFSSQTLGHLLLKLGTLEFGDGRLANARALRRAANRIELATAEHDTAIRDRINAEGMRRSREYATAQRERGRAPWTGR